jgi:phosphohistidine phosphatase SixA
MKVLVEKLENFLRLKSLIVLMFLLCIFLVLGIKPSFSQEDFKVTTVFLVRHAEKASEPAQDPPLLEIGNTRAKELAQVLSKTEIKAIYTSELLRTKQTAEPLARLLNLETTTIPIKNNLQKSFQEIAKRIFDKPGENVLVVGHSNTVPEIIKALGVDRNFIIEDNEYNNLFIVTIFSKGKPQVIQLKFGK